jgi:membrane-bound lytic murein transglycosylase F
LAISTVPWGAPEDAMRLASKYGKNRYVWNDNVESYLRLKNDSVYFTDSLCRNGRFNATETILFVRRVQHKYGEYRLQEEMAMSGEP